MDGVLWQGGGAEQERSKSLPPYAYFKRGHCQRKIVGVHIVVVHLGMSVSSKVKMVFHHLALVLEAYSAFHSD